LRCSNSGFIDRAFVPAPGTLLIQPVNEECLALQPRGRCVQERARLYKPRLLGSSCFLKQMGFASARITEQYDVRLIGKLRERPRD
jgi:hypothetical protein